MPRIPPKPEGPTAADITRRYIDEHPSIRDCLAWDVVNFTALARRILEEKGLKNEEAVTVACRRYQRQMQQEVAQDERILQVIHGSRIEVRTRVAIIAARNDWEVLLRVDEAAGELLKDRRHLLQLLQGPGALTILLEDDLLTSVVPSLGKGYVIDIFRGLAALTVRSPSSIVRTPGVLAFLANALARRGINCLEIVSSHTDSTFVLEEKDLLGAFQVLGDLVHPHPQGGDEPLRRESPSGHP
ncbi:MAG: ACT domain-containing protein [Euryarchaeota archaeon]|nr:ACT domain-containing protein [Euryarchaeota archaeon]MDE1835308.1 ACT domain-containing protein [Euryarchaeota archaeon]MDE1880579.1 ACT domain-containing protein [Euryarchaeota archaeon]MDE2043604.1 ACT domain-containing protein [Thermoplasmata archaeon]